MVMAGFIFISWSHKYRNGWTKTNKATVPLDTIKPLLIVSTFTLISKLILTATAVSTSFWSHSDRSCTIKARRLLKTVETYGGQTGLAAKLWPNEGGCIGIMELWNGCWDYHIRLSGWIFSESKPKLLNFLCIKDFLEPYRKDKI